MEDDRFAHINNDPRFQAVPKKERKVKIDKRFQSMFKDERFNYKYQLDKRGRPFRSKTSENLKRYYDLSDEDESDEEEDSEEDEEIPQDTSKKKQKECKKTVSAKLKSKQSVPESSTVPESKTGKNSESSTVPESKKGKKSESSTVPESKTGKKSESSTVPESKTGKKSESSTVPESKTGKKSESSTSQKSSLKLDKKSRVEIQEKVKAGQSKVANGKGGKSRKEESEEEEEEEKDAHSSDDDDADSDDEEVDSSDDDDVANENNVHSSDDESGGDKQEEDSDDDEEESDADNDDDESGLGSGQDLARGIGNETSSSDDSDFDSLDELGPMPESENIVHDWGEIGKDASLTTESTSRLAICNMDWENITAVDIFVVLNSFKPPQGAVLSVKIYPSEFGLKRLEEENKHGPPELAEIVKNDSDVESNDSENEGDTFHNEKLRQYEINRMKYYYAVVECDCVNTADYIYKELDGTEYEQSRTCFDMRFIPRDIEFTETARDVCTEMPTKNQYRPNQFVNNAMSSSTVTLSWDETSRHRVAFTGKTYSKKDEILMDDFKAYLASSSDENDSPELPAAVDDDGDDDDGDDGDDGPAKSDSDNEEEKDAKMSKYKELLKTAEENVKKKKRGDIEMEITWEPGLKEKTENLVKQRSKNEASTPWQEYLDKVKTKRKEKKSARKAAKKESNKESKTFSDDDMPSDVDLDDPYFTSEFDTKKKSKTQKKKEKKEKKKKKHEDGYENLTEQEKEIREKEMQELALLMADDKDDNKHHFDFEDYIEDSNKDKKKKSKKKLKQKSTVEDEFKIDLNDKRFEAVFTSGHYNIDKSAPDYKKSVGMEELIEEKLRRRYEEKTQTPKKRKISADKPDNNPSTNPTTSAGAGEQSLDSLVRSIKSKMYNMNNSKRKKLK
ncbi:ESF1 homolog [Argonauta hians]